MGVDSSMEQLKDAGPARLSSRLLSYNDWGRRRKHTLPFLKTKKEKARPEEKTRWSMPLPRRVAPGG